MKQLMGKICVIAGIVLLAGALILLGLWRWDVSRSAKQAASYVTTLQTLLPEPQAAVPEERSDNTMSVLPVDGTDFVGILEMPRYHCVLPMGAEWGSVFKYPCRLRGSIYDGTMQIGATTQEGQFDFYRSLSVGDEILYTDMEGNQYTFSVTAIRQEKHADQSALQHEAAPLTLFIKNIYAFEYLIVFCDVQ